MYTPSARFTGIFIPIEILENEDLNAFDKIVLSWIDALYCKEHHGCYASNEYIATRLKVEPNTIAKILTKLRKLNLIEDVSFDGRKRVIRSLINKYIEEVQRNPALDNRPTPIGQPSNPTLDNCPSSPYIYSKVDIKEEREEIASPSPTPPSSKEIVQRKPHVFTSEGEHQVLVEKYGEVRIDECYQFLSDWKLDTPKSKWKKHDARSISRWVVDAVEEQELKAKKKGTAKLSGKEEERMEAHKSWFKAMVEASTKPVGESYNAHDQGVTFYNSYNGYNQSECIYFKDVKFKDLIIHELRQRKYVRS